MIFLTKLDGTQLVVNDDQILYLERTPDTVITMTTGARIMVKESLEVVVERSAEFRRKARPEAAPMRPPEQEEGETEKAET